MEITLINAQGEGITRCISCDLIAGTTWLSGSHPQGLATLLAWWSLSRIPVHGTLQVNGQTWQTLTPYAQTHYKRRIGFKPRLDTLPAKLRVDRTLTYWAALWELDNPWTAAHNAIAAWELESVATQHLGTLSFGEQQRLLLAGSTLMAPDIWILEEPWTGLDARSRVLLIDRIMRMPPTRSVVVSDDSWPDDLPPWHCHGIITPHEVRWVYR
ncbi:MAG: ATP-binding cassette domain-containing protein [Sulfobacillus thermotolerans]|nr:ATP-binding cassette domain-containing protein [Sulfobacillus thermotolerans]